MRKSEVRIFADQTPVPRRGGVVHEVHQVGDPLPVLLRRQRAGLHQLEGLIAWRAPQEIEEIVDFFHMLGISRLGEIRKFQVDSFRERWSILRPVVPFTRAVDESMELQRVLLQLTR